MNEIMKEYNDEIAERSIIAKSYHAHNGNNGQKLGNRQLTNKEIEDKHGPVKTYSFDDFLTFTEFREMPLDWQAGYINYLQDKYDIGLTQINRDLFGFKDENSLRSHLKLKGVLDRVNPDKRRGRTKLHNFRRDIREYRTNPKKNEPKVPKFLEWDDFKKLARNEQYAFIKRLVDEYGVSITSISRELFGRANDVLYDYLRNRKFEMYRDFGIARGGNKSGDKYKKAVEAFRRDIAEWRKSKVCSEVANAVGLSEDILKNAPVSAELKAYAAMNVANKELEVEPVADKRMAFATSYISNGLDMGQIELIRKLFAGQKIKVEIGVEVL